MNIASRLFSLSMIVEEIPQWHFNIPIYQRLYVWGDDQVLTLLNDIINAYEHDEDIFFLGGTLLVEQEGDNGRRFDLIDGQQRFTTLWLLCHAWQDALKPFLFVTAEKRTLSRLHFAIRPEVNRFLEALIFGDRELLGNDEEVTKRMRTALALMKSVFEKRPLPVGVSNRAEHLTGLTEFLFRKVQFVITTVPRETDLNKLFEVINNRGVQLQHHEILKARMLDALDETERGIYAVLWDACADMENFIERSLGGFFKGFAHKVTECYEKDGLLNAPTVHKSLKLQEQERSKNSALSLDYILNNPQTGISQESVSKSDIHDSEDLDSSWVRSIFGFPLFLQHALRIWLFENKKDDLPRLLDRELLSLFETSFFNEKDLSIRVNNARSFINLLWKLRVLFDQHIIKWVDQGEEEVHLISSISVSPSNGKRYMSRSRETDTNRAFSLLQSMLYHSQEITTQYWITPLLFYMHCNPSLKPDNYFTFLQHLDNHMLGSAANESLAVRSLSFMNNPWQTRELVHKSELVKANGVKFAHYWFYKLEFVLWFQEKRPSEKWRNFRLTAKSSVEHISPQKPTDRDDNRVDQELNNFGNLALVSRSLNSEYSNLPYNEKRQKFFNNNKSRLDSLKMDLIYKNEKWNDVLAHNHQEDMIACIDVYCASVDRSIPHA